jgi:hypothetical protein
MNPATRTRYFSLWTKACKCQGWDSTNQDLRRDITRQVMAAVRGPDVDSITALGNDEITALFIFLEHKADDASLMKSARWVDCQKDYRMVNRGRQSDHHERALYGKSKKANKLDRNRFAGQRTALGHPLSDFDPEEVRKRHLTMASRHQAKQRKERAEADKFAAQIRADDPAELVPFEPDFDQVAAPDLQPEDILTD